MSETEYEEPSLDDVIDLMIDAKLCEVHTSLPATVLSFDGKKAKIRIDLKRVDQDDKEISIPPILDVPVEFPSGKNASITFPIDPGSTGKVTFMERSIDIWKGSGGLVNPRDPRKFNYSDAVFHPGLKDFSQETNYDADRITLTNGVAIMTIEKTGKFKFTNGTEELMDLIIQTLDQLIEGFRQLSEIHAVPTIFGQSRPINIANYDALKVLVETIKSKVELLEDA